MSENQNIEDLFKRNLNNLNVEPTSKVWEGVNSNLWYSNIQNASQHCNKHFEYFCQT